ncbi:hypothetical protein ACT453_30175 [Bacillus sp. D-CC]
MQIVVLALVGPEIPVGPVAPVGPATPSIPVGPVCKVNAQIGGNVGPNKLGSNAAPLRNSFFHLCIHLLNMLVLIIIIKY